jgi:hypothetical protein
MQRSRLLLLILTLVVVFACALGYARTKRTTQLAQQRDAHYHAALRSYSEILRPGLSRKDVEAYLRSKRAPFRQMCCMGSSQTWVYDDLTKIGAEPAPWYCSEHKVYIWFAFAPAAPVPSQGGPYSNDSDTLTEVRIFHGLEGCL